VKVAGFAATSPQARAVIGYLPERPYFHEHLTGEQLLRYFGTLSGMKRAVLQDRMQSVLALVGMTDARKVELKRYSKGMLQRIGIAQAILHNPEFLVLDEPMSGLDPLGRKEIRELIVRLAAEGHTIFFSSHVIPDVEAICDQVALIQKGKLVGSGPIGQFLAQGPLHTEVALAGLTLEQAQAIREFESVRQMPDGVRGVVNSQEAVNSALTQALAAGARVLWVSPQRHSLEEFFAR
jgi:ABC-2 type transport system ATP-binding protein